VREWVEDGGGGGTMKSGKHGGGGGTFTPLLFLVGRSGVTVTGSGARGEMPGGGFFLGNRGLSRGSDFLNCAKSKGDPTDASRASRITGPS